MLNRCYRAGDFARHKGLTAARALVVEEDAVARAKAVAFAVVHRRPVSKDLRHAIRAARPERRRLDLRNLLYFAEHFAARSLVKTRADSGFANRFQNANRAQAGDVGGVLGDVEADPHMALRGEVVNFVRLQLVNQFHQVDRVAQVAVVQKHPHAVDVRIGIKMIDARGVKGAGAPDDAVNFVALFEQQVRQVAAILSGDASNECFLHARLALEQTPYSGKHFSRRQRPCPRARSVVPRSSRLFLFCLTTAFRGAPHGKMLPPHPHPVFPRGHRPRLRPG